MQIKQPWNIYLLKQPWNIYLSGTSINGQ